MGHSFQWVSGITTAPKQPEVEGPPSQVSRHWPNCVRNTYDVIDSEKSKYNPIKTEKNKSIPGKRTQLR